MKDKQNLGFPVVGMTLRDYFAAQILPTTYKIVYDMIINGSIENDADEDPNDHEIIATLKAYEVADFMLDARESKVWRNIRNKNKNES
jgi:hypothetical protein